MIVFSQGLLSSGSFKKLPSVVEVTFDPAAAVIRSISFLDRLPFSSIIR